MMAQSSIAIIILIATFVLFACTKIPLSVISIAAMLAMAMTGIIDYKTAFAGFSNSALFLVAGMMVIGKAIVVTGLAPKLGLLLVGGRKGNDETWFSMKLACLSFGLSVFLSASLVVGILMPVIDAVAEASDGKITRKNTYMILGLASMLGNSLLTISASSTLSAVSILESSGYHPISIFAPVRIILPAVLLILILYVTVGRKIVLRWLDFQECAVETTGNRPSGEKGFHGQQMIVIAVMAGIVIALLAGVNYGAAALLGICILILSGCITEKEAFDGISWGTLVVVACSMSLSAGITSSGAGEIIADTFVRLAGPLGNSPMGLYWIIFAIASLISNVMSDNGTIAIVLPIALALAEKNGFDLEPFFLAACIGTKTALATPICVPPMTQIGIVGYRFKDYLRIGGLVNLICMVVSGIMVSIVYF